MTATAALTRLLAGPPSQAGAEHLDAHRARLGELPPAGDRREIVPVLEASGLLGRGGAAFPVGRKWRAVAERSAGDAVVVVNGAEGEPRSAKDRVLMSCRPHLVLDGAIVAADAVGANEIVLYVGSEHRDAHRALGRALAEREPGVRARTRIVAAPVGYVAGEATAAVHFLNTGDARPTFLEQRPHEAGVGDRPTLVQNVESLAYAGLIARHGDAWYRSAGRGQTRGTALVTVSGAVPQPGVHEIEYGTTLGEVATLAGITGRDASAVLVGGYFGGWATLEEVLERPLDPADRAPDRIGFGCGVVSFAGPETCGVRATAEIMTFMAGQSAAQCGPCVFGLAAIADATRRLAVGAAAAEDLRRIDRWAGQVTGRGACHHPDGAAGLLHSALRVFADEFARHQARGRCSVARAAVA